MRPCPQARQVSSSSAAGATADDGTGPVQPTSRGDSSPAGAVCGVAEATSRSSEGASVVVGVTSPPVLAPADLPAPALPPAPAAPAAVAARGLTTRSAPQASQKLD